MTCRIKTLKHFAKTQSEIILIENFLNTMKPSWCRWSLFKFLEDCHWFIEIDVGISFKLIISYKIIHQFVKTVTKFGKLELGQSVMCRIQFLTLFMHSGDEDNKNVQVWWLNVLYLSFLIVINFWILILFMINLF